MDTFELSIQNNIIIGYTTIAYNYIALYATIIQIVYEKMQCYFL